MKIVAFETEPWEAEALSIFASQHDLTCTPAALDAATATLYADAEIVSPFRRSNLSRDILEQLPALRLLATRSTGFEHIDLAYCRSRGIAVCHVPSYGDETVAEHAFALILAVARRVVPAADRTRRGEFSPDGLRGIGLRGRTLGVVGVGRIGRHVIAMAKGFGMRVIATDARPDSQTAQALDFTYMGLDDVLASADVLTLHVPGGEATRDLIDERELSLMRPGALLINTARGEVVNGPALVRALLSGRLGGAGLDVLPEEALLHAPSVIFREPSSLALSQARSLLATETLLRLPNVVVTPHIAFDTVDAVRRIVETTVESISAFAAGAPRNLVPG